MTNEYLFAKLAESGIKTGTFTTGGEEYDGNLPILTTDGKEWGLQIPTFGCGPVLTCWDGEVSTHYPDTDCVRELIEQIKKEMAGILA